MFIEFLLLAVLVYFLCGLLFAIPFAIKGVTVIDEAAKGSSIGFRIIIIPGAMLFWPYLLRKWITIQSKSNDKSA